MANGSANSMDIRMFPKSTFPLRPMGITQLDPNRCLKMQWFVFYGKTFQPQETNFLWRELSMPAPNKGTLSIFFGWLLNGYLWKHSLEQRQSMSLQNVKKPQASIKNHLSVLVSQGNLAANGGKLGDVNSIPGLGFGRCPRGGNGNPLQCFCNWIDTLSSSALFTFLLSLSPSLSLPLSVLLSSPFLFLSLPFFLFLSSFFCTWL